MTPSETQVLDHDQIVNRVQRIAWQIYENYISEKEIVIAGIKSGGFDLAQLIAKKVTEISSLEVSLHQIVLNKKDLINSQIELIPGATNFKAKNIVVIDDVLNTGSTLLFGVKYFLDFKVKSIKTVVLVDRNHKDFPIKADFKGLSLSTNLKEHVEVQLNKKPFAVEVS